MATRKFAFALRKLISGVFAALLVLSEGICGGFPSLGTSSKGEMDSDGSLDWSSSLRPFPADSTTALAPSCRDESQKSFSSASEFFVSPAR